MKSAIYRVKLLTFLIVAVFTTSLVKAQSSDDSKKLRDTILHLDSTFWEAYNACDVDKMGTFFTDDLEFYHDKGGLSTPLSDLMASVRKGLCGNENFRLRREAVEGTVKVYPLNNYGALISGEHVFYINEAGKKERLDGLAKFTHVWRNQNNEWKMSRVLSYDHGPAPYKNLRKEVSLSPSLLKQYAGKYESAKAEIITIIPEGSVLKLQAPNFQPTLYAEGENIFFLKDRDLQVEFVKDNRNKVVKMIVRENGAVVEEAKRIL